MIKSGEFKVDPENVINVKKCLRSNEVKESFRA